MIFIKKLYNVEAAAIDIKMNVALLKIRSDRFPHLHFRVQFFNSTPSSISRDTIEQSIDGGEAYRIVLDGQKVGGIVIKVDGEKGDLDLLFVSPAVHSKGIGYAAWCAVEKL